MGSENQGVIIAILLGKLSPHFNRRLFVNVRFARPIRKFELNRMMTKVACDDGIVSLRRDSYAVMTRRVSRGGLQLHSVV